VRTIVAAIVAVMCWFGVASGEEQLEMIIEGRVTDVLGRPVAAARVEVRPATGQPHQTTTDKDGRYRVTVTTAGTHRVVVAIGNAQTISSVIAQPGVTTLDITSDLDLEGGEVIRIEERQRPAVKPKLEPRSKPPLPYSEEAFERDAWARAWLLLDIDETGRVTRLKLLKTPGYRLEKICIDAAFELRFEPATDAAGRKMKTYLLWTMEWPSWGWLVRGNGVATRRPSGEGETHIFTRDQLTQPTAFLFSHSRAPCWGSGPLHLDLQNTAYRDCSRPDLRLAETLPWITRETAATAAAELVAADRSREAQPPKGSRVPGYVGFGVTAGMLAATLVSAWKYNHYHSRLIDAGWVLQPPEVVARDEMLRDRWKNIALGMAAASVLVGGAMLFLWNRYEPNFSIHPSSQGAGASAVFTTPW